MAKTYTETDLGVLVRGEWNLAEGVGAEWQAGVGIVAKHREKPDSIWNYAEDVALPFPFTLEQFRAFCAWHPFFEWEAVESQFTNDDGSLDEEALAELAKRGTASAELVRRFLTGDSDAPDTTAQQDAPDSGAQQDAAKRNAAVRSENRKRRRDLLTPVIETAQRACENPHDAPTVWAALSDIATAGKRPLLGMTEIGIKWLDENDEPQNLTLKNLRDRLARQRNQPR